MQEGAKLIDVFPLFGAGDDDVVKVLNRVQRSVSRSKAVQNAIWDLLKRGSQRHGQCGSLENEKFRLENS